MTETTRTILDKYQIRKTKKQKSAFIDYVTNQARSEGYACHTEPGYLGTRNIVVGDPDQAKVIYTAHYDTCARLPFPNFITPKNFGIYLLYQLILTVLLLGIPALICIGLGAALALTDISEKAAFAILYYSWFALLVLVMYLFIAGPANKHTANDNTSGVTTLLDIMRALPADLRGQVAFVFFDLEEAGLFGSAGFAAKHKDVTKNTLLVNFDCVSDGDNILFVLRKTGKDYTEAIQNAFPSTESLRVEVSSKGVFYPSDQANFAKGVGVAALRKSKNGILYMNRIHTKNDTVYEEENIAYLTEGAVRLAQNLSSPKAE